MILVAIIGLGLGVSAIILCFCLFFYVNDIWERLDELEKGPCGDARESRRAARSPGA